MHQCRYKMERRPCLKVSGVSLLSPLTAPVTKMVTPGSIPTERMSSSGHSSNYSGRKARKSVAGVQSCMSREYQALAANHTNLTSLFTLLKQSLLAVQQPLYMYAYLPSEEKDGRFHLIFLMWIYQRQTSTLMDVPYLRLKHELGCSQASQHVDRALRSDLPPASWSLQRFQCHLWRSIPQICDHSLCPFESQTFWYQSIGPTWPFLSVAPLHTKSELLVHIDRL